MFIQANKPVTTIMRTPNIGQHRVQKESLFEKYVLSNEQDFSNLKKSEIGYHTEIQL